MEKDQAIEELNNYKTSLAAIVAEFWRDTGISRKVLKLLMTQVTVELEFGEVTEEMVLGYTDGSIEEKVISALMKFKDQSHD